MPDAEDLHRIKRPPPGVPAMTGRLKEGRRAAGRRFVAFRGNRDVDLPARFAENLAARVPGRRPQSGETHA